jgi:hypothetical protein
MSGSRNDLMKRLLLLLSLTIAISSCTSDSVGSREGNGTPGNSQARSSPAAIQVSAVDLFRAYQDNRGDADRLYKGKTLIVTGSLFGIQRLEMHGSAAALIHVGEGKAMVTCAVVNVADDIIDKLKEGDQLRVKGHCDGLISVSVALHDCKIE